MQLVAEQDRAIHSLIEIFRTRNNASIIQNIIDRPISLEESLVTSYPKSVDVLDDPEVLEAWLDGSDHF